MTHQTTPKSAKISIKSPNLTTRSTYLTLNHFTSGKKICQFKEIGLKFGGARPIFTRCFRIFRISSGFIIMAMIFIGEPEGGDK